MFDIPAFQALDLIAKKSLGRPMSLSCVCLHAFMCYIPSKSGHLPFWSTLEISIKFNEKQMVPIFFVLIDQSFRPPDSLTESGDGPSMAHKASIRLPPCLIGFLQMDSHHFSEILVFHAKQGKFLAMLARKGLFPINLSSCSLWFLSFILSLLEDLEHRPVGNISAGVPLLFLLALLQPMLDHKQQNNVYFFVHHTFCS